MTDAGSDGPTRADVVVVGGGPAGASAAVFSARYGLDTIVFDRGNAALSRCAYLENYLGFPAGIGVETFSTLMTEHVVEAGATYVTDMVESVESAESSESPEAAESGESVARFVVETQDGRRVATEHVVAAAWYDGDYLRGLDDDDAMFELHDHHGEMHDRFDPSYPDDDGRTPVDGLYVAAPCGDRNAQVAVAAGQGAHVARCLLEDLRREQGFPGELAAHYDWLRPDSEFRGEWGDRDRWREWFDNQVPDDADVEDERLTDLRESYIDRAFETRRTAEAVEEAELRGVRRFVETIGTDRVLNAIPDEALRAHLESDAGSVEP